MTVIAYDIGGPGRDGAIHEFIIVRIGRNQIKAIGGVDVFYIDCIGNCFKDI